MYNNYWGNPDISVSFCEKKYDTIFWIAEYYNTISAVPYLLIGTFFFYTKIRKIGLCILFMGASTMIMHGSLRYYGQWMDEISLLTLSYETLKQLNPDTSYLYITPILGIYLYFNEYFLVFLFTFSTMQVVIVYRVYISNKTQIQKILSFMYVFFFLLGMLFWVIDQHYCKYIGNTPFHALWHICTCLAMFYGYCNLIV